MSALDRLATALGARLEMSIADEPPLPPPSISTDLLTESARAPHVVATLAASLARSRAAVRTDLVRTLDALTVLLNRPPTTPDLDRLLDLIVLADNQSNGMD